MIYWTAVKFPTTRLKEVTQPSHIPSKTKTVEQPVVYRDYIFAYLDVKHEFYRVQTKTKIFHNKKLLDDKMQLAYINIVTCKSKPSRTILFRGHLSRRILWILDQQNYIYVWCISLIIGLHRLWLQYWQSNRNCLRWQGE